MDGQAVRTDKRGSCDYKSHTASLRSFILSQFQPVALCFLNFSFSNYWVNVFLEDAAQIPDVHRRVGRALPVHASRHFASIRRLLSPSQVQQNHRRGCSESPCQLGLLCLCRRLVGSNDCEPADLCPTGWILCCLHPVSYCFKKWLDREIDEQFFPHPIRRDFETDFETETFHLLNLKSWNNHRPID